MKNVYYKAGVYALKAVERNQIYIGSTNCFKTRKNLHFSALKKKDIKRAVLKLIEPYEKGEIIDFEILEVCENYLEREQYWINFYKNHPLLTLINTFDAKRINSSVTNDFKQKMSDVLKKRWLDPNYRKITVDRLSKTKFKKGQKSLHAKITLAEKEDKTLLEFESAKLAAEYFGFKPVSVVASINRNRKHKNIRFFYKEKGPE